MGAAIDASSSSSSSSRVPACEPCRERKTRCNRAVPCSSCLTAKIPCHVSNTRPEKRQRVLISSKYDEALESVDSRLQQLLDAVNSLQGAVNAQPQLHVRQHHYDFSSGFPASRQDGADDAYRGDSSFEAQSWALPPQPAQSPSTATVFDSATTSSFSEILTWTSGTTTSLSQQPATSTGPHSASPRDESHLISRPLPPSDAVLRLLRLTQTEKQRFFLDVDLFDEPHFTDLCKRVFFAINPYSPHTWAIVNTGLYYLFHGLDANRCVEIGVKAAELEDIVDLLARNVQVAVDRFQICHDASLEACQALALLGTFCMKSGQVDKAGSLFSASARTCLDLGLHDLQPGVADMNQSRGRKVLWYVFLMEKGLALTLGRPQVLHFYDITTDTSSHPNDVLGIPAKIAAAFFELALIENEMIPQLFSASARHLDSRVRWERGQGFHERLGQIRLGLILRDTSADSPFNEASILVNVLVASVKTLICWAAPGVEAATHGCRQACADCVDDARWVLRTLGEVADTNTRGWTLLLNIILCLAPFTPYLVLAAHSATSKDTDDLLLLERTRDMLSRAAPNSPIARGILETCSGSSSSGEPSSRPLQGSIGASDFVPQLPFITISSYEHNEPPSISLPLQTPASSETPPESPLFPPIANAQALHPSQPRQPPRVKGSKLRPRLFLPVELGSMIPPAELGQVASSVTTSTIRRPLSFNFSSLRLTTPPGTSSTPATGASTDTMSVIGYQAEQQRIYNGPVPWPTPPGWYPPGTKRPLANPEAYHAPIPHPSQRQRPPDSYWPVNDPNPQNAAPQPGMPFYAVGQPQQQQQQTHHDFSLGAVGQAAPPPLEAELLGLADPATLAKKRSEMVAKLDKLSPNTIKALLLEASLRNFTVADQVNLEHDKITNLAPGATVPASMNGAIAARLGQTHPQPLPSPAAPTPRAQRKPPVSFDHYNDASWRELTRYDRYSCSKQFDLAVNVSIALGRMFANISRSVSKNDHFLTKSSALHAMLTIWDNCFDCTNSEVGKQVRMDCHDWAIHLKSLLRKLDADDARKLRNGPVKNGSVASWVECAGKTRDVAGTYCSPVKEALVEAINTVNSKARGEEVEEDEEEDDDEYDEEEDCEEEDEEEDYDEEEDEEEVREYEPAIAAQPNSHPKMDGGTRSKPVILD